MCPVYTPRAQNRRNVDRCVCKRSTITRPVRPFDHRRAAFQPGPRCEVEARTPSSAQVHPANTSAERYMTATPPRAPAFYSGPQMSGANAFFANAAYDIGVLILPAPDQHAVAGHHARPRCPCRTPRPLRDRDARPALFHLRRIQNPLGHRASKAPRAAGRELWCRRHEPRPRRPPPAGSPSDRSPDEGTTAQRRYGSSGRMSQRRSTFSVI